MKHTELATLFDQIGNINSDEFVQLSVLGYMYGRRYSEQLSDKAKEKDIENFANYASQFQLDCGLFANILRGHLAVTFEKGEPAFHITVVGEKYVQENILKSKEQ